MDKKKMNSELSKLMQNKKFVNCLIVLLVVIFLWLAVSTFMGDGLNMTKGNNNNIPLGAQEVISTDGSTASTELLDYESKEIQKLKDILGQMDGVGNVEVTIYFESGEVKVPATNSSTQVSETQEEDKNGGVRVTKQETDATTVVMQNDSGTNEPYITTVYKPQITGIFIVAEGAKSSQIKYDIQTSVASLYNLTLDKVNVYPMKS